MAHLSLEERETIESNLKEQKNFTQIGELIGKHRTTISNEILNHRVEHTPNTYGRNLVHCALEDSCEKYHGIGYKKMPRTTKTFSITHTAHHLDPFFYLFHKFH